MRISILILGLKALKVNKKNFDHIQLSWPSKLGQLRIFIAHIYWKLRWRMTRTRAGEAEGQGGGGSLSYKNDRNACRKIRIKPPEGDQFGRGSTLFHPERRPNTICYVYLGICFWGNAKW